MGRCLYVRFIGIVGHLPLLSATSVSYLRRLLLISLPRRDRGLSVDGVPRGRFRSAPVTAEHCTGAPHERLPNQSMTKVVGSSSRSGGTSLPGILAGCLRPRGGDTSTVAFPKNVCQTASSRIENKNLCFIHQSELQISEKEKQQKN